VVLAAQAALVQSQGALVAVRVPRDPLEHQAIAALALALAPEITLLEIPLLLTLQPAQDSVALLNFWRKI
jgi:hypothetical protein